MLKKRLIGVITVKGGWAVQSFGYERYLPLGKPEVLAENLDRWGADEIILQCIDRSCNSVGPDFDTLSRVASKGLGTPLIYIGGIRSTDDGRKIVQSGADRVALDALLYDSPATIEELSYSLGAQALIASLPVSYVDNKLYWYDYRSKSSSAFSGQFLDFLKKKIISEVMLIDWMHEGQKEGFQINLIHSFPVKEIPIIAFGGLSSAEKISDILSLSSVNAVAIGNFLNYKEHAVSEYKQQLNGLPMRMLYIGQT